MNVNIKTQFENNLKRLGNELRIKNPHALPRIEKIVVTTGVGKIKDKGTIDQIKKDISTIAGQAPVVTKAKKSIAGFKLRQGDQIGLVLNLRGKRMYNFLYKLIHVALPAIRDFRGIRESSFDNAGNLTIGIREYAVFPEISYLNAQSLHGLSIIIRIRAASKDQSIALMKAYGLPVRS